MKRRHVNVWTKKLQAIGELVGDREISYCIEIHTTDIFLATVTLCARHCYSIHILITYCLNGWTFSF
jgi:hypothetical protein